MNPASWYIGTHNHKQTTTIFLCEPMHPTLARRALGNLVPPKIATPASVSGGSAAALAPLVQFYSKLPKGPAPKRAGSAGAWLLNARNASGKPIVATIASLMILGYTIEYQMHLKHHKNHHH